jgi:hypothetical protein
MKTLNIILDIIGITASSLLIMRGDGDFGDYLWVFGALFFCVADLLLKYHKNK